MTTTTPGAPSAPAGLLKRVLSWAFDDVPPHEMTDGERNLKRKLFAVFVVSTAAVILLMAELNYYSHALAKANEAAAAQTASSQPLQVRQQAARRDVWEPVPLCWVARCGRLK